MNKIVQIARCLSHPRELRLALSGLAVRAAGDGRMGGLSAEETAGLVKWVSEFAHPSSPIPHPSSPDLLFVEIGTLFGFTAKAVAATGVKVTAVDNFSWNPFGLTSSEHEAFTRRVLEGTGVELVNGDALSYISHLPPSTSPLPPPTSHLPPLFVFLDGDHRYEAVKREIEALRGKCAVIAGHDYGNESFGVTQAVDETLGKPDALAGSCWVKRLKIKN